MTSTAAAAADADAEGGGTVMRISMLPSLTSRRSSKQMLTKEECVKQLRGGGIGQAKGWNEMLKAPQWTKLYLDRDEVLATAERPAQEVIEQHEADVRRQVERILEAVSELMSGSGEVCPSLSYVVATRHGYWPKEKCYKLSSRPYVSGVKVQYHEIPLLLKILGQETYWDTSVYKEGEQLLGAINCVKGVEGDSRVLRMQEDASDTLLYVAQHTEADWPSLDLSQLREEQVETARTEEEEEMEEGEITVDAALLAAIVLKCVPVHHADNYGDWIKMGLALKRAEAEYGSLVGLWIEFSKRSRKFEGEKECKARWRSLKPKEGGVTLGTVHAWAKAGEHRRLYEAVMQRRREARAEAEEEEENLADVAMNAMSDPASNAAACKELRKQLMTRWPQTFTGQLSEGSMQVEMGADGTMLCFKDRDSGMSGAVFADMSVCVDGEDGLSRQLLGELAPGLELTELARVHPMVKPDVKFKYARETVGRARLQGQVPHEHLQIEIHQPFQDPLVRVTHGRDRAVVKDKKMMEWLMGTIVQSAMAHAMRTLGSTTLRECFDSQRVGTATDRVRNDDELTCAWLAYWDTLPSDERGYLRVSYTNDTFHYYLPHKGLWFQSTDRGLAANQLLHAVKTAGRSKFWNDMLSQEERDKISSARGRAAFLQCALSALAFEHGADIRPLLDSKLDLLPFNNGVVDLSTGEFRKLRWDDYVTTTAGYDYVEKEAIPAEDFELVNNFYSQVLPIPQERELLQRGLASGLSGNRRDKLFFVLTDKQGGNNGKSVTLGAVGGVYGNLAVPPSSAFLYSSASEGANSHAANDLHYQGKRLAMCDETTNDKKLNVQKIKMLTSGEQQLVMRGANQSRCTEFTWTALIVIACNEGNMPEFSASEEALMNRMMVVPFRSKFTNTVVHAHEDSQFTFSADPNIKRRLSAARAAHLHILLDAYKRYQVEGLGPLPEACLAWKQGIAADSDPDLSMVQELVETHVEFNLTRRPDQKGCRVLGFVKRDYLMELVRCERGRKGSRPLKARKIKEYLDIVMKSKGRPLHAQCRTDGMNENNVYLNCALSTESEGERRFRAALKKRTGLRFEKARPRWLKSPLTGHALELDMWNEEHTLAVEYDGAQHWEYPNKFHKSLSEFEAQQMRDRSKEEQCRSRGYHLVRVRACADLEAEMEQFWAEVQRLELKLDSV